MRLVESEGHNEDCEKIYTAEKDRPVEAEDRGFILNRISSPSLSEVRCDHPNFGSTCLSI
jgi:hypothetical protein